MGDLSKGMSHVLVIFVTIHLIAVVSGAKDKKYDFGNIKGIALESKLVNIRYKGKTWRVERLIGNYPSIIMREYGKTVVKGGRDVLKRLVKENFVSCVRYDDLDSGEKNKEGCFLMQKYFDFSRYGGLTGDAAKAQIEYYKAKQQGGSSGSGDNAIFKEKEAQEVFDRYKDKRHQ
jgi:hypothetical protein